MMTYRRKVFLCQTDRLDILAEGYIYPKQHRAVRDLLRRRLLFVRHRTAHILSLQSMISRNLGFKMSNNELKKLKPKDIVSRRKAFNGRPENRHEMQ